MTRGDAIQVRPTNNVYTALTGIACLIVLLGLIALFVQANSVFGDGLFLTSGGTTSTR